MKRTFSSAYAKTRRERQEDTVIACLSGLFGAAYCAPDVIGAVFTAGLTACIASLILRGWRT